MSTQLTNTEVAQEDAQVVLQAVNSLDLSGLKVALPVWHQKSQAAQAALQKVVAINTDAEDTAAEALLVKVRKTYDLINGQRLAFTRQLDDAKSACMEAEKAIDPSSKANNHYSRVKGLRDARAQAKLKAAQEEQAKALAEQRRRNELTRLKSLLELRFVENITNAVKALDGSLATWLQKITLDTFAKQSEALNVKPVIKKDIFESWFAVDYDRNALSQEQFTGFMQQVRAQYTYELVNTQYQNAAKQTIEDYKAKLPGLKSELERIAALNAEQAAKAQEELKKQQDEQAAARARELDAQQQQQAQTIQDAAASEKLNTSFDAALALQSAQTDLKGVRKTKVATISCAKEDIVQTIAKMLFSLYLSAGFPGHIKRNKATGEELKDADGRPVYADWLEELLSLYAQHVGTPLDGITIAEVVSTIQKSK